MPKLKLPADRDKQIKTYRDLTPDWLEKIIDFTVGRPEEPDTQIMQMAMPTPMVSAYAKMFGGEAAKGVRMKATEQAIEQLKAAWETLGAAPEKIKQGVEFLTKYPRIAAHHAFEASDAIPTKLTQRSAAGGHYGSPTGLGQIKFAKEAMADPVGTLAHEMTHGAHQIGLKEFADPLYADAERMVGYGPNPHEKLARFSTDARVPIESLATPEAAPKLRLRTPERLSQRGPGLLEQLKQLGIVDPNIPEGKFMETARAKAKAMRNKDPF